MRVSRGEYVLCIDFRRTVWIRIKMGFGKFEHCWGQVVDEKAHV